MKNLIGKYLGESKYIVKTTNRNEYLVRFDFENKKQLAWSKDKEKAMEFPDKGSAEAALDRTVGSKWGVVLKKE